MHVSQEGRVYWCPFPSKLKPCNSNRIPMKEKNRCRVHYTVKSQFNDSRFNIMSRFKVHNRLTKMIFYIKKSQSKESKRPLIKSRLDCTFKF